MEDRRARTLLAKLRNDGAAATIGSTDGYSVQDRLDVQRAGLPDLVDFGTGSMPTRTSLGRPVLEQQNGVTGTLVRGFDADGFYGNTASGQAGAFYVMADAGAPVVWQKCEFILKSGGTANPDAQSVGVMPWTADFSTGTFAIPPTGAHMSFSHYAWSIGKILTTNGGVTVYASGNYPRGYADYDVIHSIEAAIDDSTIYLFFDGEPLASVTDAVLDVTGGLIGNFAGFEDFKLNGTSGEPGIRNLEFSTSPTTARSARDRYLRAVAAAAAKTPADPRTIEDDFLGGNLTSGSIGTLGWSFNGGGGSTGQVFSLSSTAGHPGVRQFASPNVAGTIQAVWLGSANNAVQVSALDFSSMTWVIQESAAGVSNNDIRLGFFGAFTTATPTVGLYFELLTTDTNWHLVCQNGGSQTRVDTGVAGRTTNWLTLRLFKLVDGTFGGAIKVNGGTESDPVTVDTNTPVGNNMMIGFTHIVNDTTFRLLNVDYFQITLEATAR